MDLVRNFSHHSLRFYDDERPTPTNFPYIRQRPYPTRALRQHHSRRNYDYGRLPVGGRLLLFMSPFIHSQIDAPVAAALAARGARTSRNIIPDVCRR
ncbi:hypothetical protein EVAR_96793_1 [Eumeta japonica]|uniref:Uncharacterized protein n=1 Tax=Eumeta variegata TaxID=151549 RepID=A0A4C1W9X9_EUMVA|nr:hypothetical protein EVAR_96793_1 [Eumeta japonica]